MINTAQLEHIVKLALLSAYIKGEHGVSILVSAKVESGKTELVKKAQVCQGVLYMNDLTAFGIGKHYLKRIANREVRTIIIPDLLVPFAKQHSTVETFIAFMNGLIEEGQAGVSTAFLHLTLPKEARCNLITSTTRSDLHKQSSNWMRIGFLSRIIPVTYEYAPSTVQRIMRSIALREYQHESQFTDLEFPKNDVVVDLPINIALQIETLTALLSKSVEAYGFRLQKQIQTLCMASALFNKRTIVEQVDFDIVSKLADHFNVNYKQV